MPEDKFRVEHAFEELDTIVETLEKEETSLDEALNLYKKGITLVQKCRSSLDNIEKELIILDEKGELQ